MPLERVLKRRRSLSNRNRCLRHTPRWSDLQHSSAELADLIFAAITGDLVKLAVKFFKPNQQHIPTAFSAVAA